MDRTVARRGALHVLAVLGVLVAAAAPAGAADVTVRRALFGMHDATYQSLPGLHEGTVRLWNVGVKWQQVETAPGVYDWTRLDDLVTHAQAAHAQATMVVAMTPSFYSADSTKLPRSELPHYRAFVRALMERYRDFHGSRGISAYQVWNEANISNYWTGTPHQMARLTLAMDRVRDTVDPGATVVAPPMATRLAYQLTWLKKYDAQHVRGVPVWHHFDVAALHLYPLPTYAGQPGGPEASIALLGRAKALMKHAGMPSSIPIWNTEVNYGLQSAARAGQAATPISQARQASYVMRTYLLDAAAGIKRVYWYRYELAPLPTGGTLANTLLSVPGDPSTITKAGHAYVRAQRWMRGTLIGTKGHRPCARDSHGTYRCVVKDGSVTRWIYWNPDHRAEVRLAPRARRATDVLGRVRTVKGGSRLTVNYRPVLVRH